MRMTMNQEIDGSSPFVDDVWGGGIVFFQVAFLFC